ncbi:MAG: GMC oxidoreductase [Spongiibacteraceae bacterium]
MQRISTPLDQIKEHYDVVVIGSGYGGGVAASRMARAGRRVCLLERGREIVAGEFPDSLEKVADDFQLSGVEGRVGSRTALFDFHVNDEQNVLVGCGLGGTSLINANVSLPPDNDVLNDARWPQALRNDCDTYVREGFERAREMLKPTPYPESFPALKKFDAHKKAAAVLLGDSAEQQKKFYRPPINVNFDVLPANLNHVGVEQHPCNGCGDCVSGCNHYAKNHTRMNYLPDAWNHGAEIFCQAAVRFLEKDGDGWIVHFQYADTGREKFSAPTLFVKADIVIVSAGTLGSTEILLRSRQKGLALSSQLGKYISGNGDIFGFGYNCDEAINGVGFGSQPVREQEPVGPCITSVIDMRDDSEYNKRMVIEEGSLPGAIGKILASALSGAEKLHDVQSLDMKFTEGLVESVEGKLREWDSVIRGPYYGAVHNTQTYLIMSHDDGNGRAVLDDSDYLRIDWPRVGEQPNFKLGNERAAIAAQALGGSYVPNPLWNKLLRHSLVTVHPLGGCIMGEDAKLGVVNHKGQVFSGSNGIDVYENLYVTDGAVIPTSLAVNPLLTITAISERAMALLAKDRGWTIDYTLPSAPKKQPAETTLGIQFTETMRGFFSTAFTQKPNADFDYYERAYRSGKEDNSLIEFTVTVTAADLQRLIDDPKHPGTIVGTLNAPLLSSQPLTVSEGKFNLFETYPDQVGVRHMCYSMKLTAEDGADYFFSALKCVPEGNSLLCVWADTSTLYTTIFKGSDASGEVIGCGVLHIDPIDFAKQMTTLKVLNSANKIEQIEAVARFGKHFAGVLWETYGGVFAGDDFFDPDAPPRQKRVLNVGAPDVFFFKTEDGVELRLTRYRKPLAKNKGPVMLVHGAGVASTIFSTDTIPTNLLEYLYNHDYDVWLLDFRVSILLPASKQPSTGDQVAKYDFPAAIDLIRKTTGAKDVQCVVHCYGATTFFMSMLAGLQGVRSIVCSQIATDLVIPMATAIKTGLYVPTVLEKLGLKSLTAYTDTNANWFNKLYDKALDLYALVEAQGKCDNPVCHRITFMYSSLYRHDTLNETLHENLHELFGETNMRTFEHLALMCREGKLLSFDGEDIYMPHMDRLQLPICFISGEHNECYLPESTERTYNRLRELFDPNLYARHVIPNYGHIDCIFGKNAAVDVYPIILGHLEKFVSW